jgi:hypothetical protein
VVTAVIAVIVATVPIVVMIVATTGVTIVSTPPLAAAEAVAPLEGGEAVAEDVAALPPGLTSRVRSATRRDIRPKTAGLTTPRKMSMVTRRFMLLTVSTPIGTRTPVPPIISQVSSTI